MDVNTAVTTTDGTLIEETARLIASDMVEGTAVYNRQGERLGTVHNFIIDKSSGQVAYAVMSFGGFLGVGQSYHPLPWKMLNYHTRRGGFVVDIDRSKLEMIERTHASKVDELEALLNDPDMPLMPDRGWALLAEVANDRADAGQSKWPVS
jgi:hypothetical protein